MTVTAYDLKKKLDFNQKEMAELLGVHIQTWRKWEWRSRFPTAATKRLMEAIWWMHETGVLEAWRETINDQSK